MAEPRLVCDCVSAIREAVKLPVTVKHRVGIDRIEDYGFVEGFVSTVAEAGCHTFIVHARNAVLKGLSPKQNREVPPLKYDYVYRLKQDFPQLTLVINGGIVSQEQIQTHLAQVDGVMLGRAAYSNPWMIADAGKTRAEVVKAMVAYAEGQESLRHVTRHMLGLYHGQPSARLWRRMLSDSAELKRNDPGLLLRALEVVEGQLAEAA
jgi:tRNA-dihydrouridine synthase A